MGGGDLNMKKSWHPLLMKNQERVWKEERKALEERKKTAQLQKELAEERQLQELQRIQAEQGGGRREERLEWLYATPASGNAINAEEQEAYLLGKKTVDKLFREKDEAAAKLQARAASKADADKAGGGFISLQNANTARDTASKIREDPLLAIKQQEQLAYETLKKNPAKLKALQSTLSTKEERKKEKEEKKKLKRELKDARKRRHDSNDEYRDRSSGDTNDAKRARAVDHCSRNRSPSHSPDAHSRGHRRTSSDRWRNTDHHVHPYRDPASPDDNRYRSDRQARRSRSPSRTNRYKLTMSHDQSPSSAHHSANDKRQSFASQSRHPYHGTSKHRHHETDRARESTSSHHSNYRAGSHHSSAVVEEKDQFKSSRLLSCSKATKLAEMQAAAKSLQESRSQRLKQLEAEDAEKMKIEEAERERNRIKAGGIGDGNKAKFVIEQEKQVFFGQMGLAERVKRSGGVGLQKDRE